MRADVDGDGMVSILDFAQVARWFQQVTPPTPERMHQDGDGRITILDLARMAPYYRKPVSDCT
jgi:hypothetical protein